MTSQPEVIEGAWHVDGFRRMKRLKPLRTVLRRLDPGKRRGGASKDPEKIWQAMKAGFAKAGMQDRREGKD